MDKNKELEQRREEEKFIIQDQEVRLDSEEENPGIGYEIVIGSS